MTMRISQNRIDLDDKILRKPVLEDYGETIVGGASGISTGSSYTVDCTSGNVFNLTLTANCTFTFSNAPASGTMGHMTLILRQDATGSRTVTWPAGVVWPAATAPTLTTTPGNMDVLQFSTYDGGVTWFGFVGAQAFTAVPDVSFVETDTDATSQTTYTFSSASLGDADALREVFVIAYGGLSTARTLSSGTIGGVSATIATNQYGGSSAQQAIMFASVPTGTTGDVVVTWSGAADSCRIAIYRVVNRGNFGSNETDSATSVSGATTAITVSATTVNTNGFVLGVCGKTDGTEAAASSVFTQDANITNNYFFAHYPFQTASSTPSQQWSWTTSTSTRASTWAFD